MMLRRAFLFSFLLLACSCSHTPSPPDPNAAMHAVLFSPPGLRESPDVQPYLTQPDLNIHRVDWHKIKGPKPLSGLRVALDPGHVGGTPWDERNGKYVVNSAQTKLSEGTMALALALLLEKELKLLGAEVFIDRRQLVPVTARDFGDFAEASGVFFQRLDLDARAEKIWAFRPDITLILHFDAGSDSNFDFNIDHAKHLCNNTKAYVPGSFEAEDLADKDERPFFQIIWRNPLVWQDSVDLSRAIVGRIHATMGVPLDGDARPHTFVIEPGIFTRNLRLQRRLAGFVTSYLESLCYEDPGEFRAFSAADHAMKIDGHEVFYSRRMVELANAIRDGVLSFVTSRNSAPTTKF